MQTCGEEMRWRRGKRAYVLGIVAFGERRFRQSCLSQGECIDGSRYMEVGEPPSGYCRKIHKREEADWSIPGYRISNSLVSEARRGAF